MDRRVPALHAIPAIRVGSRVQVSSTFFTAALSSPSPRRGGRGRNGQATGPPPPLTAEVRIVIRQHFPVVGPGGTRMIVKHVAEDIALRHRPSRHLRQPDQMDRALAKDVLPLIRHPFDRNAVVKARKEICEGVAAACADPRIASGGAHVLVVVDTFACHVVLRRCAPPSKKPAAPCPCAVCSLPESSVVVVKNADPCKNVVSAGTRKSVGVIGDGRKKPAEKEMPQMLGAMVG